MVEAIDNMLACFVLRRRLRGRRYHHFWCEVLLVLLALQMVLLAVLH